MAEQRDPHDEWAPPAPAWNIQRAGRQWSDEEWEGRWALMPRKVEAIDGEIIMLDTAPGLVLGALLEYLGRTGPWRWGT